MPTRVNDNTNQSNNKLALVTGASRGIGRAIARALAQSGFDLAICSRTETQIASVRDELLALGCSCYAGVCDVRNAQSVATFVENVRNNLGRNVDILINNAGIYKTEPLADHSETIWSEVIDTNLTGAMLFCKAVLKGMIEQKWGRIINISSVSGRTGEIWGSAYSASKFGMIGLTQSAALEVAQHGVTVNAVCPGWVSTEMSMEQLQDPNWCKLNEMDSKDAISNACFAVPQNRFIEPEEVAALVVYLASDAARGITGQSINICGGLSLQ